MIALKKWNDAQVYQPNAGLATLFVDNANAVKLKLQDNSVVPVGGQITTSILYDAIVAQDGSADYELPSEAFDGGHTTVYVKNGQYIETNDIVIPDGGVMDGETADTTIILTGTAQVICDGGGVKKTNGTITTAFNSVTITGVGTTFAEADEGKYIQIGTQFYQVANYVSATEIELTQPFRGQELATQSYMLREMKTGVSISNLAIVGNASVNAPLQLTGVLKARFTGILVTNGDLGIQAFECGILSFINVLSENCTGSSGFLIQDSYSINFTACNAANCDEHGFHFVSGLSITMDNCQTSQNTLYGIYCESENTIMSNSHINRNRAGGVYVNSTATGAQLTNSQLNDNQGLGIRVLVDGAKIETCRVKQKPSTGNGIQIDANDIDISGCEVSGYALGINITSNGSECQIVRNFLHNNSSAGIFAQTGGDCTIKNNKLKDNGASGATIDTTDNIISGNIISGNTINGLFIRGDENSIFENRIKGSTNGINVNTGVNNTEIRNNNLRTAGAILDNGTGTVITNNKT